MADPQDIRWLQRFENFQRALQTLERAMQLSRQRELTELEQQGLIQGFEFTHELAWNVLKDYLQKQGFSDVIGSRDATPLAFQNGLIADGDIWMDMICARSQSSQNYILELAQSIAAEIISRFPQVERAVLYGFRAKGKFKPGSDIDLTLAGKDLTPQLLDQLADALDDLVLP